MGLDQKNRSLHCGLQKGLEFEIIEGENVLLLKHVPYELEDIIARWIGALSVEYTQEPTAFIKLYFSGTEIGLTQLGWSAFICWMTNTLVEEQFHPQFEIRVCQSAKKSI